MARSYHIKLPILFVRAALRLLRAVFFSVCYIYIVIILFTLEIAICEYPGAVFEHNLFA